MCPSSSPWSPRSHTSIGKKSRGPLSLSIPPSLICRVFAWLLIGISLFISLCYLDETHPLSSFLESFSLAVGSHRLPSNRSSAFAEPAGFLTSGTGPNLRWPLPPSSHKPAQPPPFSQNVPAGIVLLFPPRRATTDHLNSRPAKCWNWISSFSIWVASQPPAPHRSWGQMSEITSAPSCRTTMMSSGRIPPTPSM